MSNIGTLSQISTEDKILTQFKIYNAPIVKPALEVMVQVSDDDFTATCYKMYTCVKRLTVGTEADQCRHVSDDKRNTDSVQWFVP